MFDVVLPYLTLHVGLILDAKLLFASHIKEKYWKQRSRYLNHFPDMYQLKYLIKYLKCTYELILIRLTYLVLQTRLVVVYHVPGITNPFGSSINLNYLMNTLEMTCSGYYWYLKRTNLIKIYSAWNL